MENENKDTQVETVVNEKETTKTYTQDDINNSYNAGLKKAKESKDYKEFEEWKKTHQSQEDKLKELETNNGNLINENATLKAQLVVAQSDIKKEFVKFVTSEIMSLAKDGDYEKALSDYKKTSPQYFGEVQIKKVQSSPTLQNGTQPQTTNDIMNNLLRGK